MCEEAPAGGRAGEDELVKSALCLSWYGTTRAEHATDTHPSGCPKVRSSKGYHIHQLDFDSMCYINVTACPLASLAICSFPFLVSATTLIKRELPGRITKRSRSWTPCLVAAQF